LNDNAQSIEELGGIPIKLEKNCEICTCDKLTEKYCVVIKLSD